MNQFMKFSVLGSSLFFLSSVFNAVFAAPTIDSIVVDDQANQVIVSGTNFTSAPTVMIFDSFENGVSGSSVKADGPEIGTWEVPSSSDAQTKYVLESDGNMGFLARDLNAPSGSQLAQLVAVFDKNYKEIFLSYSVKVPDGSYFSGASSDQSFPDVSSWKLAWLISGRDGFYNNDGKFDLVVPTHVGRGTFMISGNDGTLSYISGGSTWWSWHDYNNISFYMKIDANNPSSTPVRWKMNIVSPKTSLELKDTKTASEFSGTDFQFDRLNIPGWFGNGSQGNFQAIYDNIYIAVGENSQSRIVITDAPNISESKKSITVPPKDWSATRISFDSDLMPDWTNVYVHIYDQYGNPSSSGETSCPECPSAVQPSIR